jgi:hypothetical protein
MSSIKWMLEVSLTKTLAAKLKCKVTDIYDKFGVEVQGYKGLQVVIERPGKKPLVATYGCFPFERIPEGMGVVDFRVQIAWNRPITKRAEVVQRLVAGRCELCGVKGEPVQAHHVRKLADLEKPGRRPKADWQKHMAAMKRKTLVVCADCHRRIHGGHYDGPSL